MGAARHSHLGVARPEEAVDPVTADAECDGAQEPRAEGLLDEPREGAAEPLGLRRATADAGEHEEAADDDERRFSAPMLFSDAVKNVEDAVEPEPRGEERPPDDLRCWKGASDRD